jgi:Xaa-Pro aminopeptidase
MDERGDDEMCTGGKAMGSEFSIAGNANAGNAKQKYGLLDPEAKQEFPVGRIPAPGAMAVDYEKRVDFDRLRDYRLRRVHEALDASAVGALLCFDTNNIRYTTSTQIGEWARDKLHRFSLLARNGRPMVWDFGSAAAHHRLHCPWLEPEDCRAGLNGLRGAIPPENGLFERTAKEIASMLREQGVADMPLGVDVAEPPMLFALQAEGITVVDGQQIMLDAREIKSQDEIMLLTTAASMVDGAYQTISEILKPGVRESEIVAAVNKRLYEMGSDDVEAVNAVSGERCSPHPHNFSDRLLRPGDQAFFDIIHSFNGYRTCYYRTLNVGRATTPQKDAYAQAREWIDMAIQTIKPGVSTKTVAEGFPAAEEFGFDDEFEAFGLQFGHGLGLGLHERPIISRVNSLDHPMEIKENMVFALETYCPASDGVSAARIEEEVVVTADGCEVITLFPAEELFIANEY